MYRTCLNQVSELGGELLIRGLLLIRKEVGRLLRFCESAIDEFESLVRKLLNLLGNAVSWGY